MGRGEVTGSRRLLKRIRHDINLNLKIDSELKVSMEPPIFYSKAEFIETVRLFLQFHVYLNLEARIQETRYLDALLSPVLKISSSVARPSSRAARSYVVTLGAQVPDTLS